MNNSSKIIIFFVLCLAVWWCYDKFGNGKFELPSFSNKDNIEIQNPQDTENKQEKTTEQENTKQNEDSYMYIYLLTADKSGGQYLKPVKRPLAPGRDRLTQAVNQLFLGPNNVEYSKEIYSEIPGSAKLISVTNSEDKVILNVTESFGTGGGSDSTYSRMRQLIKTVLANSDKPVYLQIEGKQVDVIGGEGITVTQPLSEKSLDE